MVDRKAPGRWVGRHPVVCALIMAFAIASPTAVGLISKPSLSTGVLTAIGFVSGAGLGLLLSFGARKT